MPNNKPNGGNNKPPCPQSCAPFCPLDCPPGKTSDFGPKPFVVNIERATLQNNFYRTALWTGKYLQLTLMSIRQGDDIGIEMHPNTDQFIRIEQGNGIVMMGDRKDNLNIRSMLRDSTAILIPAGTWHNVVNTGRVPLKLYSIYAPPHHPHGTVQVTKFDAQENHK